VINEQGTILRFSRKKEEKRERERERERERQREKETYYGNLLP
jgi:hypothetical protein